MPYVHCGAARMLSDEQCTGERLRTEVEAITGDPERWRGMARASAAAGRPDAAQRVADLLKEVATGGRLSARSDDGLGESPSVPRGSAESERTP
jgi:hypothetical protein